MSFKKNIIANYTSQIYMSLAGILILPLYLKYMGAEAYGLVGFFATLQIWFNMLDMGLTPTISKETARMHGGALTALQYRGLLRALQFLFILTAIIGTVILIFLSDYLSYAWLKVHTLPLDHVKTALQLMAIGVALRWLTSLYRAVLVGSEQFVWLCGYNFLFTSFRYLGVLFVLIYIGTTPIIFFTYQIIISGLELLIYIYKARKNLPTLAPTQKVSWYAPDLFLFIKPILPFALGISATTSIWVLVTQTDKLILSKLLSLSEYGYFTLGVLAASGVMMLSSSISTALMPRLAKLKAENNMEHFFKLYSQTTQLVAAIVIPVSLVLSLFPEQILFAWTKNIAASQLAAPVLRLYALGNAALSLTAFPFYLQYAYGTMKLHLIGNIVFVVILLPSIVWATNHYGVMGAGWVWLLANFAFFILWTAIVHNYYIKNFHVHWVIHNIAPPLFISSLIIYSMRYLILLPKNSFALLVYLGLLALTPIIINMLIIHRRKTPPAHRLKESVYVSK